MLQQGNDLLDVMSLRRSGDCGGQELGAGTRTWFRLDNNSLEGLR